MGKGSLKFHFFGIRIDLFRIYVLFSQCEVCGSTLENCFFQISPYLNIYILWFTFILGLNIIFFCFKLRRSRGKQNIHTPLLGRQNIQAKEVYRN